MTKIRGRLGSVMQHQNHILIVDDDPVTCLTAEFFLDYMDGFQATSVQNGIEALELIDNQASHFDYILCDLKMPEMDGIEFLRNLKQRNFSGKIVIISGEHDSVISLAKDLAHAHNLSIIGTLQKPLKEKNLKTLIYDNLDTQDNDPLKNEKRQSAQTKEALKAAIEQGHIKAFYQPQVNPKLGKVVGVEALARWDDPEKGLIPPIDFIPLAEAEGMIVDLTDAIFLNVIRDMQSWQQTGFTPTTSINLSADGLSNIHLPDKFAEIIDKAGLDRGKFVFEITESKLLENKAVPMEVLARMHLKGFELSIDDFGTAYSNIEYLQKFPFNELKIDRIFVCKAASNDKAQATVEACAELARKLGLRVIAEGVETLDDLKIILGSNIDIFQGFLASRPLPSEKLLSWVHNYHTHEWKKIAC
ncbi:MAG: EAL domain-containing response regulator [Pseudomonadota bacterium]